MKKYVLHWSPPILLWVTLMDGITRRRLVLPPRRFRYATLSWRCRGGSVPLGGAPVARRRRSRGGRRATPSSRMVGSLVVFAGGRGAVGVFGRHAEGKGNAAVAATVLGTRRCRTVARAGFTARTFLPASVSHRRPLSVRVSLCHFGARPWPSLSSPFFFF